LGGDWEDNKGKTVTDVRRVVYLKKRESRQECPQKTFRKRRGKREGGNSQEDALSESSRIEHKKKGRKKEIKAVTGARRGAIFARGGKG